MKYWSYHFSAHRHKVCRVMTRVRGRKHHISITLHSHGCHTIRAAIAVVIWVARMRKTRCSPFNAAHFNMPPRHYCIGWSWELRSPAERGVQRRKRQLQSKLTSCLSYCLLKSVHKRGGKTAMFLPSMVQSVSPTEDIEMWSWVWGHLWPKKREKNNLCLLPIFQC